MNDNSGTKNKVVLGDVADGLLEGEKKTNQKPKNPVKQKLKQKPKQKSNRLKSQKIDGDLNQVLSDSTWLYHAPHDPFPNNDSCLPGVIGFFGITGSLVASLMASAPYIFYNLGGMVATNIASHYYAKNQKNKPHQPNSTFMKVVKNTALAGLLAFNVYCTAKPVQIYIRDFKINEAKEQKHNALVKRAYFLADKYGNNDKLIDDDEIKSIYTKAEAMIFSNQMRRDLDNISDEKLETVIKNFEGTYAMAPEVKK